MREEARGLLRRGQIFCKNLGTSSRRGRRFEPYNWRHNGATILHSNTKVLDFQGLFVFLGVKNTPPFTIAPFLASFGLEPATLRNGIERITFL